jgi:hypothetical protein
VTIAPPPHCHFRPEANIPEKTEYA